jgi:hypothetical protein
MVGKEGAETIQQMIAGASKPATGIVTGPLQPSPIATLKAASDLLHQTT